MLNYLKLNKIKGGFLGNTLGTKIGENHNRVVHAFELTHIDYLTHID